MIHINRGGTSLGTFSEDDVREGLRAGRFTGTDLGWREGMTTWLPLSQIPEFTAAGPGAPPPPSVPGAPSIITPSPGQELTAATAVPRSGLPWEQRKERGFFKAFIETMVMILSKPAAAFTIMKREGGLLEPLVYAVVGVSFGYLIYFLFALLMPSVALFGDQGNPLVGLFGMGIGFVFLLILLPLFIGFSMFLGAAIIHLCLMILGGAKQTFETTFRVVCFSAGATGPLVVLPVCGGLIAGIWGVVAECIGLSRAHEIDIGRAVMAVLLPLIVCCGLGLLAMTLGFFGAFSALGS